VAQRLHQCAPLQHLDLTNAGAHAAGARAIFSMLMLNTQLRSLVLDQNAILEAETGPGSNPEAAHGVPAVIGEALAHNTSLVRLGGVRAVARASVVGGVVVTPF
jgi:hypothetical protein